MAVTLGAGLLDFKTTAGQVPAIPAQEPMRLRIRWGGGVETQWAGRIGLDAGGLSELDVAELNADGAGSVWLEDNQIAIGSLSPRTAEVVEVSALASPSATLLVELSPVIGAVPVRAQVALAQVARGPYQLKLDERGNTLSIENITPMVSISTDRRPLIFAPGERFAFEARISLKEAEPGTTIDVQTKLVSASGETMWSDDQRLSIPLDGPPMLALNPQLPLTEGVYTIHLAANRPSGFRRQFFLPGAAAPLAQRTFEVVVLNSSAAENAPSGNWQSVLEIDPTSPRWWDRLPTWSQLRRIPGFNRGPLGSIRAASIQLPLGQFVELPSTSQAGEPHWQAYSLPLESAGVPHLLEIDYPADKEQHFGVALVEPNSSDVVNKVIHDTGVFVEGLGLSENKQKQTHRIVFWPRSQAPLLLVTNQHPKAPAHFGQIRVLKYASNRLAAGARPTGTNERIVAAYIALPHFEQSLGTAAPTSSNGQRWNDYYQSASRLAEYLVYAGYNSAVLALDVGYLTPDTRHSTPILAADGLELLLRVFDREQLVLMPALNLATPLPQLEPLRRSSDPQTSGLEWVGPDGRSWLQTFGTRDGQAPYYNLLDPRVQEVIVRLVGELVDRYSDHGALGGIAVQLSSDGYAQLPPPEWGLDDATIARFERDTSIQIDAAGPNRFVVRSARLNGPHAAAWREWRAAQVTEFYRALADRVCSGNEHRRLVLTAERSFDHPQVNSRILPKILNAIQLDATLLSLGLDRAAVEQIPGITFCATRYISPAEPLQDRAVDLEISDAFATRRRQSGPGTSPAALLYHRSQSRALGSFAARSPIAIDGDFRLACQPLAHEPALLQPYALTLADADCHVLIDGSDVLSPGGNPSLRDARQLLQRLPVSTQVTEVREQPLVVRSFAEPHRVTLLVINASPWQTAAQIALDLQAPTAMTRLAALSEGVDPSSAMTQMFTPGGPPLALSLEPYAVQAVRFDNANVKVNRVTVRLSDAAKAELTARLADLAKREPAPRIYKSLVNPGFEPIGGGAVPGWRMIGGAGGAAELDATSPHEGKTCLYLQSSGQSIAVESEPFPTPPTGQFAMTAFVRGRNLAPGSELRMVVEAEREKRASRWSAFVGGPRPGAHSLAEQWSAYPILVNELPLQSDGQTRVRFELTGAGEVWIDRLETYDLLFPLPFYADRRAEFWEFVKVIQAAQHEFKSGRITDCVRRIEGYWPRFYTAYTPLAQQRLASQPSGPADPSPSAAEPPQQPSQSVTDRFRNLLPFRR
jgi:hypothetical protein